MPCRHTTRTRYGVLQSMLWYGRVCSRSQGRQGAARGWVEPREKEAEKERWAKPKEFEEFFVCKLEFKLRFEILYKTEKWAATSSKH